MSTEHSNVIDLNQAQQKKPCLWSYVLCDPADNIVVRGEGHTRNACQRQAMLRVAEHPDELTILHAIVRSCPSEHGFWRFVATPPSLRPAAKQRPAPYRPSWSQIEALMLGCRTGSLAIRWVGVVTKTFKTVTSFACSASSPSIRCGAGISSMRTVPTRRAHSRRPPTRTSRRQSPNCRSGLATLASRLFRMRACLYCASNEA